MFSITWWTRHAWQGPNPRKFTYWSHLGAMLFGQWSARKSLRDLVFSVNRQARKLYHLGLSAVKRSTLADANQQRPAVIFEKTYYKLYERLSAELAPQPQEAPQIKIIDATTIDLCAAVFPWAKFRTRKGAIKLHTVLTGLLPQCVLVTDGKTHDLQAVQDLRFKPGLQDRLDAMYIDKLDGRIAPEFFDRKSEEWRREQADMLRKIEKHQNANHAYLEEGGRILELAQHAVILYEKQEMVEKRRLLNFVFSNSSWKDGRLTPVYRKPFDLLAVTNLAYQREKALFPTKEGLFDIWLPGTDSNRRQGG